MKKPSPIRMITLTLAIAVMVAPTVYATNDAELLGGATPDADIDDLAGLLNSKNVLRAAEKGSITCGAGCGQCVAEVDCGDGYVPTCTCRDTGNTCGALWWKKAVYECTCTCTPAPQPPEPPKPFFCVSVPEPVICIEEPPILRMTATSSDFADES